MDNTLNIINSFRIFLFMDSNKLQSDTQEEILSEMRRQHDSVLDTIKMYDTRASILLGVAGISSGILIKQDPNVIVLVVLIAALILATVVITALSVKSISTKSLNKRQTQDISEFRGELIHVYHNVIEDIRKTVSYKAILINLSIIAILISWIIFLIRCIP